MIPWAVLISPIRSGLKASVVTGDCARARLAETAKTNSVIDTTIFKIDSGLKRIETAARG